MTTYGCEICGDSRAQMRSMIGDHTVTLCAGHFREWAEWTRFGNCDPKLETYNVKKAEWFAALYSGSSTRARVASSEFTQVENKMFFAAAAWFEQQQDKFRDSKEEDNR